MKTLIHIESIKLFRSTRSLLTFCIGMVLMWVIVLGLYTAGEEIFAFLLESLERYFVLEGEVLNGYLITYLALNTLWVHIPILIVIVTAYIFAGDFELGTIKSLLTQEVSRTEVLLAKFVVMCLYVLLFMLLVALAAFVPAYLIFGPGDLMVFMDGLQILDQGVFLSRLLLSLAYSSLALLVFGAFSMLMSLIFQSTLTSILISLGLLILSTLLQKFVLGVFSDFQALLFSYHFSKWQYFFMAEMPVQSILQSTLVLAVSLFAMLSLAWRIFKKMNITA